MQSRKVDLFYVSPSTCPFKILLQIRIDTYNKSNPEVLVQSYLEKTIDLTEICSTKD